MKEVLKMKIGLRAGHSPNCLGAIGIVNEYEQMKKFYGYIVTLLQQYGHTVVDCNSNASSEGQELFEGANKANESGCDLFVSLHMNSFNGSAHGTEVLVSSSNSTAYPYAKRLVDNYSELGFYNRGVKFQKLYEMNHVSCGNIISEICFCDSAEDIEVYNKYSWEKLAHVFCNAIDSNIPKNPTNNTTTIKKYYVVTNYLPHAYDGYDGVDINYVLSYFKGIKTYVRGNAKGVWIETEYLSRQKCEELKKILGSWFYEIKEE
ncbi:N-acetylmuramoyl-L-alanine amidase [Clostridium butyricum]|uniref:N-acetylmuramoyl-L-alanine amidase n=2 Tax=Clostridium butyricum TaxID=1492 RepID=UPI002ABD2D9A|nr:N-acetylmuramoyl-L-alanine amidase [Clostridium butyricum]